MRAVENILVRENLQKSLNLVKIKSLLDVVILGSSENTFFPKHPFATIYIGKSDLDSGNAKNQDKLF